MFDTHDEILADARARLGDGATSPGSAWRNLALATRGLDGTPQVRTVVLRRFDSDVRLLEIHTDTRSAKHAELSVDAAAAVHGWDAEARVQLRVSGCVSLHTDDGVADRAWDALRSQSRATYRARSAPGTVLAGPGETSLAGEDEARAVFCVVQLAFRRLEWLQLGQDGHRRARFTWTGDQMQAVWLAP